MRGEVGFGAETFSDPVLIRGDGVPLYTLATVVDDIDFGITQILRGEDHVANTAIHVQLFEALGGKVPEFGHFALIADAEGGKLSKRAGALSIAELREAGLEPMALLSLLARLGTSDPIDLRPDLATLIAEFDIARFGRSPPKLDTAEFWHLNAKLLHHMDFATARPRLPEGASEAFWLAVRGNLTRIEEAADWWAICSTPIEAPPPEDPDLLATAAGLLPEILDQTSWKTWTAAIKSATGKGGRALFHPLRLALTGRETGPELAGLLPLIGRARALERLGA